MKFAQYLTIGQRFDLPMLCLTNTWRANPERIQRSSYSSQRVNWDCVAYYRGIVADLSPVQSKHRWTDRT